MNNLQEVVLAEELLAAYVAHDFVEDGAVLGDVDLRAVGIGVLHLFEIQAEGELLLR